MTALLHRVLTRARLRMMAGRRTSRFTAENRRYARFEVGAGTYGEPDVVYWDCGATLRIGRYCSHRSRSEDLSRRRAPHGLG